MYIYGLYSSLDGVIRYVGKTNRHPTYRKNQHLSSDIGEKKVAWIEEVYASGGSVEIMALEELEDASEGAYAEGYWIYGLRGLGYDLVNTQPVSTKVFNWLWDEYRLKVRLDEREVALVKELENFHRGWSDG